MDIVATHADDLIELAYVRAVAGDPEGAHLLLSKLGPSLWGMQAFYRSVVHAVLGEREAALTWLRTAAERGWKEPPDSAWYVEFRALEGDAEYEALRTLMTLR